MHDNTDTRDAKRILHNLHSLLCHIQAHELHYVAKALGIKYCVPQKVMIKAMRRYVRIHHTH